MEKERSDPQIDWFRSFYFFADDPQWAGKLLVGGLFTMLSTVVVGSFFVCGYVMRLLRAVARGDDKILPDWSDWQALFADGALGVGLYLCCVLPPVLPVVVISVAVGLLERIAGPSHTDSLTLFASIIVFGFAAVLTLVLWMIFFYLPSAFVRVAITRRFGDGFAFRANVDFIRRNFGNYLLAMLLYLGASSLSAFGYLLCCVGIFVTGFWSMLVYVWALGQVARRDAETLRLLRP